MKFVKVGEIKMVFEFFFYEYKKGLKDIQEKIPLHRKILLAVVLLGLTGVIIPTWYQKYAISYFYLGGYGFVASIIFKVNYMIEDKKSVEKNKPCYSQRRLNMLIQLFNRYHFDIYNIEFLNGLIEEAKRVQKEKDSFDRLMQWLKYPVSIIASLISTIIISITTKLIELEINNAIWIVFLIFMITILGMLFFVIVKWIVELFLRQSYGKYEEFIDDLHQLKLFYGYGNFTSLTNHLEFKCQTPGTKL